MKYLFFYILLLPFVYTAQAQDIRLAGAVYSYYPQVKFKDNANSHGVSFQEFSAFVNYPRQLKNKKTILINGLQYGTVHATSGNNALPSQNELTYHKISYMFTFIHRFNDTWTFVGRLSPTIASDFEDKFSGHDFLMQGSAIVSKKYNENVLGGAGLLYSTRFGKPMLIPSLQYQYKKNNHTLNAFLPVLLNYSYQADGKLGIGFRTIISGGNFNASARNFSSSVAMDRFNYTTVNIGPFINYQLGKIVLLEAFGGISAMRRYEFENTNGDNYKYSSQTGSYLNIGFYLVPPQK